MFRGDPPHGKLLDLTQEIQTYLQSGYLLSLSFEDLVWTAPSAELADKYIAQGDLYLKINLSRRPWKYGGWEGKVTYLPMILAQDINQDKIKFDQESIKECIFDDGGDIEVTYEVEQRKEKTDCFCLKYKGIKSLARNANPHKIDMSLVRQSHFDIGLKTMGAGIRLHGKIVINMTHETPKKVWKRFTIEAGSFYDCIMPEKIEALWGPIPLSRLPPGCENECKAVTHSIMDGNRKVLSVYLVHSLPLEMSAIQIFHGDKMAVVAHLVGQETIGHEPELHLHTDFENLPWRAMIIKDNEGMSYIKVNSYI